MHDVGHQRAHIAITVDRFDGTRSDIGLVLTNVLAAKQYGPRQVRFLDAVHVHYDDVPEAEQAQIFKDFIAKSASADHQHFGFADFILVPPGNQAEPAVAVLADFLRAHRNHVRRVHV